MDRMTRNSSQGLYNNQEKGVFSASDTRRSDRRATSSYGKACSCGNGSEDHDLLQKIREIDFAIYEVVLYLDAYPHSSEALAHYRTLIKTRMALLDEYQSKVGPITMFGNTSEKSWDWAATPWPWE